MCKVLFTIVRGAHAEARFRVPGTVIAVRADAFAWPADVVTAIAAEQLGELQIPSTAASVFDDLNNKEITTAVHARTGEPIVRYRERRLDMSIVLPAATKLGPGTWTIARNTLRNTTDAIYERFFEGPVSAAPAYMRA